MKILKRSVLKAQVVGLLFAAIVGAGVVSSSLNSCATLSALANLSRIQFMLQNVQSVTVAGINVANKHSVSDFSVMDGINLMQAFTSGRFPMTFTLNVAAKNPNAPNTAYNAIQVTDFPWHLLLDGKETISGNIGAPLSVPNGGTTEIMPLQVTVDLKQFFQNNSYNDMLNLALALSGQGGSSHVQLKATPSMATPLGSLRYPGELTIVNTQFSS
jgi:hypothetical protein